MFSLTSIKTKVQLFLNSKAANVYNESEKTLHYSDVLNIHGTKLLFKYYI